MTTSTRQKLVESAVRRFYRDGFRSVGIDQVLTDVGISKTAFYKHFESKEDLMLAALEMQNEWLQETFLTRWSSRCRTSRPTLPPRSTNGRLRKSSPGLPGTRASHILNRSHRNCA